VQDPDVAVRIAAVENGLGPRLSIASEDDAGLAIDGDALARTSIRRRMEFHGVRGVSVAVINEGRLEWARGYGYAHLADERPVRARTLFQSASIGKPITALASLALVERGVFELDADIRPYLKSWTLEENRFTEGATISLAHLLSHSAGMTVHGFGGYRRGQRLPGAEEILNGESPANSPAVRVDLRPGSRWRYSGGGYQVLQQMIVDSTEHDFRDVIAEEVFGPIEMRDSVYMPELTDELEERAAFAYLGDGSPVVGGYHIYPEFGAGAGLWTTAGDLARFAIHVQECVAGSEDAIISTEMARRMLTRTAGVFGLGLVLSQDDAELSFSHSGGNLGYRNYMFAYASGRRGVVIMTNSDRGDRLCTEIRDAVAEVYGWPDFRREQKVVQVLARESLVRLEGLYDLSGLFRLEVLREGGNLSLPVIGSAGDRAIFYPESPTRFFSVELGHELEFDLGERGEVAGMLYFVDGMELRGSPVD